MPQLNRDILREIFYEIVKKDGTFKNIDKFMLAGREPFHLVLGICQKTNSVAICKERIFVEFPGIRSKQNKINKKVANVEYKKSAIGTNISIKMLLFKPIYLSLASSLTSLDIRYLSSSLLKMIDHELKELYIACGNFKAICKACSNISNIQNGVTIKYYDELRFLTFPCQKLTIIDADFEDLFEEAIKSSRHNEIYKGIPYYNPHLQNIHDLTINGTFCLTNSFPGQLKEFASFLTSNFQNLKTLNFKFSFYVNSITWEFDDYSLAEIFQCLPHGIKGCITFKLIPKGIYVIDLIKYPNLEKNGDEYYKIYPISDILCLKLAYGYEA